MDIPVAQILIIVGTITGLSMLQYLLNHGFRLSGHYGQMNSSQITIPDIVQDNLAPGLSIKNLDRNALDKLRSLIENKDVMGLTSYLAFTDCHVIELERYLKQIKEAIYRETGSHLAPAEQLNIRDYLELDSIPDPPANFELQILDEKELRDILQFEPDLARTLTREFMSRFGGIDFHLYYQEYALLEKAMTLNIPPDHPKRNVLEFLASSGIALEGREIPLEMRLTVLTMAQLKQVAKDLNIQEEFHNQAEAIAILGNHTGAKVSLSMLYPVDNLFMLKAISENEHAIASEWNYFYACAKVLIGKPDYVSGNT